MSDVGNLSFMQITISNEATGESYKANLGRCGNCMNAYFQVIQLEGGETIHLRCASCQMVFCGHEPGEEHPDDV